MELLFRLIQLYKINLKRDQNEPIVVARRISKKGENHKRLPELDTIKLITDSWHTRCLEIPLFRRFLLCNMLGLEVQLSFLEQKRGAPVVGSV